MQGPVGFMLRRSTVLAAFLVLKLVAVVVAGIAVSTTDNWTLGAVSMAVYAVIAWFAWQRRGVSIWAMTLIMLFEASGALLTGLRNFTAEPILGAVSMVVAVYLVLGALVVFSSRHKRQ